MVNNTFEITDITLCKVQNDQIIFDALDEYLIPEVLREFKSVINKKGKLIFIPNDK